MLDGVIGALIGVGGAVIGAALLYWFDIKRAERERHQAKLGRIAELSEEIRGNHHLVSDPFIIVGIGDVLTGTRLSTAAWQQCKADLPDLPDNLADTLRHTYAMVVKLNTAMDSLLPVSTGHMNSATLGQIRTAAAEALGEAIAALPSDISSLLKRA
jgi:hypothetical protein